MYESLAKKALSSIAESHTIADGLSVRKPGDITFEFVKRYMDRIELVSDEEILRATAQLIKKEHVLAEPSGAAAFAALVRARREKAFTGSAAAIVSGGNISSEVLSKIQAMD
jgi:threonine dehydratase